MLMHSDGIPLGTVAPDFELPGTDGRSYALSDFADAKALVVVFTCNHCPYAIAAEARLVDLQARYKDRGVQVVAINPNSAAVRAEDGFDAMVERARDRGFNFPYLHDESQAVAKAYKAVCTPDIFVFDGERKLVYNGRLDDNWQQPEAVTRQDLARALDAVLAGQAIDFEIVPSMGCSIKWHPTPA